MRQSAAQSIDFTRPGTVSGGVHWAFVVGLCCVFGFFSPTLVRYHWGGNIQCIFEHIFELMEGEA